MDLGERLAMADTIRSPLLDYQGKEAQLRAEEERAARLEEARVRRLDGAREREERLQRAKERIQQEDCEVRDLKNRLDAWVAVPVTLCPAVSGLRSRYPTSVRGVPRRATRFGY
ncbi:hypothetical protein DL98DRAFT_662282 [Cadophora sp. DSE1049]|nr:hypothetical protein DL98DRAFT_662282 [Cadophora sp. DSE1049]